MQRYDPRGGYAGHWGGEGSGPGQFTFAPSVVGGGVAADGDGNVYIADGAHRVQKFDRDGHLLATWGSYGFRDGQFRQPVSVAVNGRGEVYVADLSGRIQKFDRGGRHLAGWGGRGSGAGEFEGPTSLAIDAHDTVYAADSYNHRVQAFDPDGNYLGEWGGWGHDAGRFDIAGGIAVDGQGFIYVGSLGDGRIQKFRLRRPRPPLAPRPFPVAPGPALAPPLMTPADR